jgi:enoyl-CoA hydratase/carnithine racemase
MIVTIDHETEQGAVREIRLDRPPANALSPELIAALGEAVAAAPSEGARALVISGRPGLLSGGLDVPHLIELDRAGIHAAWTSFYAMMRSIVTSPVPVIAAVTGHAPAGGAVISILCDHRVMAGGDWKIGFNEVHVGIPLPPVILLALQRLVGFRQAERLVVTGMLVSAAEALRIGLVDELVAIDDVISVAIERGRSLLQLPPATLAEARRRSRADLHQAFASAGAEEVERVLGDWFSDEAQGVLRSVAERLTRKKS